MIFEITTLLLYFSGLYVVFLIAPTEYGIDKWTALGLVFWPLLPVVGWAIAIYETVRDRGVKA